MSDQDMYAADGPAVDLARIAEDDRLLDLLGAGGEPAPDDPGAVLLAAWRADIVEGVPAAPQVPSVRRAAPGAARSTAPARRRRVSRASVLIAAGVAALVAAGGTVAAAADAGPDSPLWPITRLVYADRASSAVAEQDATQALDQAKAAIDQKKYDDAAALLDQAEAKVDEVRDPTVAQRLRNEIATVRGLLTGLLGGEPSSQPSTGPSGSAAPGQPGASGAPGSGAPQPSAQPSGLLPTCLLPTGILPLPLPSLPGVIC